MRKLPVLALLAVILSLAGCASTSAVPEARRQVEPERTVEPVETRTHLVRALEVLHTWDARRAAAWARQDDRALKALYVPGSSVGRVDERLLRAYADRGLVVRRIRTQVLAVEVLDLRRGTLLLRVRDRVAGGALVRDGRVRPLQPTRPVTRRLQFRLRVGQWRLARSTEVTWARGPHGPQR